MFDCKPIFFLDEIQIVDGWEKFARRLADHGYRVYITGSNAKMLSNEIATILGGRYIIQNVYPFSFKEYLTSLGIDLTDRNFIFRYRAEMIKAFDNYFRAAA
jgi:predicted AAA+ superfamily ATPase